MIPLINRLQLSSNYYDIVTYLATAIVCAPIFIFSLNCGNKSTSSQKEINLTHWHYLPVYLIAAYLSMRYSRSLLISRILYLSIPLLSLILLNSKVEVFIKKILRSGERVMLFIASISYALYLIHMPIVFLFGRLMPDVVIPNIILIVIVATSLSILLEHYFQKRVIQFFKKS